MGYHSPVVEICEWTGSVCASPPAFFATYTTTAGPGGETVSEIDEHYQVDWHTNDLALNTYRIRVLVADGTPLGHADVELVSAGNLKNIQDDLIPLKDGRTLPIKFRIEAGAGIIGPAGGTIIAADGNVTIVVRADPDRIDTVFTVTPLALTDDVLAGLGLIQGTVYEFEPHGQIFDPSIQITISYSQAADAARILTHLPDRK